MGWAYRRGAGGELEQDEEEADHNGDVRCGSSVTQPVECANLHRWQKERDDSANTHGDGCWFSEGIGRLHGKRDRSA